MKSWPKVSVTIITYNHEVFIADALDSVINQQYPGDVEIIVRDDCSTDNTPQIIKKYANMYSSIKPVLLEKNTYSKGVEPMADAFKYSSGDYIFFLEGDDYWLNSDKIMRQVKAMLESDVDLCFHPMEFQNCQSAKKGKIRMFGYHLDKSFLASIYEVIEGGPSFMSISSIAVKTSAMSNLPSWFYEGLPYGDFFLQVLCSRRTGALYLAESMGYYRFMSPGSWTANQRRMSRVSIEKHHGLVIKSFMHLMNELGDSNRNIIKRIYVQETINSAIKALNNKYKDLAYRYILRSIVISPSLEFVKKIIVLMRIIVRW